MKIIFLDVDGVINPHKNIIKSYFEGKSTSSDGIIFDKDCLTNLKEIVDNTNAEIVLSSSWRKSGVRSPTINNLLKQLSEIGLYIIDFTPIINDSNTIRGDEIDKYLKDKNYKIDSYIIIDDCNNMGKYNNRLVHTNGEEGLTKIDVDFAISLLNNKE